MSLQNMSFFFLDGKARAVGKTPNRRTPSELPVPCLCARATSIPIRLAPVVTRFRTPTRKASARLRRRRSSIRKYRSPPQTIPEGHQRTRNLVFQRRQRRNVQCTRSGSTGPPSRAVSEPAISPQESSNGGRISSRSSGTVRLPTVDNHPLSSSRLGHFPSHPAEPLFIRFPRENVSKLLPFNP